MTDMNITLERIDSGLRELTREVRDLRADYKAHQALTTRQDDSWAWLLGPVLLVVLIFIGVAAAEAIHVLRALG
jgi:hypothetical protein